MVKSGYPLKRLWGKDFQKSAPEVSSTGSLMLQESQGERSEYQNNSYIHHQTFPEKVSEEQDIHADYDGYQEHDDNRYNV